MRKRASLILAALMPLMTASPPAKSQGDKVPAPFVFTEDENLPDTDLLESILPTDALRQDALLNRPFTRLDYFLMQIEHELDRHSRGVRSEYIDSNFEPLRKGKRLNPSVHSFARFNERTGKVLIGFRFGNVGPPKKPLRDTCDKIIESFRWVFAQEVRWLPDGRVLGVLDRREGTFDADYTSMLTKLAENVVYRVSITTSDYAERVNHHFDCQKQKEGPTQYSKFGLKELPPKSD